MGRAEGTAHRMIDEDRSWRDDPADDVEGRARQQSRNVATFEDVRDETDGLVTKWSVGDQQGQVNFGLGQFPGDGGRKLGFDFLVAPHTAHNRNVKGR